MTGTGELLRLALRRDRVRLAVWLALFVVMSSFSAAATVGLYPEPADRVVAAETFNDAQALVALYGRVYDPTSIGALSMIKLGGFGAIFVALFAIMTTVRHTRAEEESGRQEFVGSGVVGRRAPLTAALLLVMGFAIVLAVSTGFGLTAAGLPVVGSFAFGAAWGGVCLAFAAITAVVAQLTRNARTAVGLAVATLGVVYVLRAVGDVADRTGPGWLTWLSPIGWGQQFRPYAGDRWWVLLITIGFTAIMITIAFLLVATRDLGTGLIAERPGAATAAAWLRSPLALAWRLQRATLAAWIAGFALLGLVFGSIASSVQGFFDSAQARELFLALGGAQELVNAYFAATLGFIAIGASAYGIQAAARLRGEEASARAELLLSTGVARGRWVLGHAAVALVGTATLLLVAGGTAGFAQGLRTGDPIWFGRLLGAAAVQVPAACVLVGIAVAGFGLASRASMAGWVALGGFIVLAELGPLLRLGQWLLDLSPYTHSPKLPGGVVQVAPLIWLSILAVALLALGVSAFRRRDLG